MPDSVVPAVQPVTGDPFAPESLKSASVTPGSAMILSVFPRELKFIRPYAGRFTYVIPAAETDKVVVASTNPERLYQIPAGPGPDHLIKESKCDRGAGYSALIVCDTYEIIKDYGLNRWQRMPQLADEVAQYIANEAQEYSRSGSPNPIGVAKYNPGEPLETQLARLRITQQKFFEWKVAMADKLEAEKNLIAVIQNPIYRIAAQALGLEHDESRTWFRSMDNPMKTCPFCGRSIRKTALGCEHCKTNLAQWYSQYPGIEDDPFVAQFLAKVKSPVQVEEEAQDRMAKPKAPASTPASASRPGLVSGKL